MSGILNFFFEAEISETNTNTDTKSDINDFEILPESINIPSVDNENLTEMLEKEEIKLSIKKKNNEATNENIETDNKEEMQINSNIITPIIEAYDGLENKIININTENDIHRTINDLEKKNKYNKIEIKRLQTNLKQLMIENSRLLYSKQIGETKNLPNIDLFKSLMSDICEITIAVGTETATYKLYEKNNNNNIINQSNSNYFNIHNLKRNTYYEFCITSNKNYEIDLLILGIGINYQFNNIHGLAGKEIYLPFLVPGKDIY